ncbi:glycosyltransferase [Pseudomonadales bacterium]|nr:glycosyltransferase [Pseudomonadales bacterium]
MGDLYQTNVSTTLEKRFSLAKEAFAQRNYKIAEIHTEGLMGVVLDQLICPLKSSHGAARYSIIIVSYSISDDLVNMLASLKKYEYDTDYEILLVNNGDPGFYAIAAATLTNYTFVDVGFNYGCSGGRNVGINVARGEYCLFLDDDGVLSDNAVEVLIETIQNYDAITCRGKVIPRSDGAISGGHYDKGSTLTVSVPDAEGMSIWKRDPLLKFGGFDTLLSGHEGLCVCSKMYKYFGPYAFLYTPEAVLYHDYASSKQHDGEKRKLHGNNRSYLDYLKLPWNEVNKSFRAASSNEVVLGQINGSGRFFARAAIDKERNAKTPVTVITTAKNGEDFLDDYVASLKFQRHENFNVVFVDDASSDATLEKLSNLWDLEQKITVIQTDGVGRSAALNLGLEAAETDICLIADVDDISIDKRFSLTVNYFSKNSEAGCLSFYCFNENGVLRAAKPFFSKPVSLKDRCLVGMPASFPSFAFRRSEFTERFDESLEAGVDCDWIYRNFANGAADGHMLPVPGTFYRIHEQQITTKKRDLQKAVVISCLQQLHGGLLGSLTEKDKYGIGLLSGWEKVVNGRQVEELLHYINRVASNLDNVSTGYSSASDYLYLAWNNIRNEVVQRDYRNWRGTALDLKKSSSSSHFPPQIQNIMDSPSYGTLGWRRIFILLIFPFIKVLASKTEFQRFKSSPLLFMLSLKQKKYWFFRRIFFPQ